MNILIVVVLAVFWAIGGIVKSKAEQARMQKNKQSPPKAPPRPSSFNLEKFLGLDSSNQFRNKQQRPGIPDTRPKPPYAQPARDRFSTKPQFLKSPPFQNIKHVEGQKFSLPQATLGPKYQELAPFDTNLQELPEFTSEGLKKMKSTRPTIPMEVPMSQSMLDFTDVDSLKRAILYYEILGKPMSLRDE